MRWPVLASTNNKPFVPRLVTAISAPFFNGTTLWVLWPSVRCPVSVRVSTSSAVTPSERAT